MMTGDQIRAWAMSAGERVALKAMAEMANASIEYRRHVVHQSIAGLADAVALAAEEQEMDFLGTKAMHMIAQTRLLERMADLPKGGTA